MDITERKITKIAREAEKLVLRTLRETDVGTAEIDLIHALRHNPGCTQAALAKLLHADKAAIARRTRNLEAAAVSDAEGRAPESLQSRDRGGVLRVPAGRADAGRSSPFCRGAQQALCRVQGGKPRGLPALYRRSREGRSR